MAVFQIILCVKIQLIYLHWWGMRWIVTTVYTSENDGFLNSLYRILLICITQCSGFVDRFWWHRHVCSDPENFVLYNWTFSLHITLYLVHWSTSQISSTFYLSTERRFGSQVFEIHTEYLTKTAESVEALLFMQNIWQSLWSKKFIFMILDDISFIAIPKSILKHCYINIIKKRLIGGHSPD